MWLTMVLLSQVPQMSRVNLVLIMVTPTSHAARMSCYFIPESHMQSLTGNLIFQASSRIQAPVLIYPVSHAWPQEKKKKKAN